MRVSTPEQSISRSARAWGPDPASAVREALGKQCANVGSSLGALALLKRHFGLGIEVGRQGQERARQRRKCLREKWLFLTSRLSTLLLVTRKKARLLLILFRESSPGEAAKSPQPGLKLACLHKEMD